MELESMGTRYTPLAAISPTQNAACERAGGAWKMHAKSLCDEFSITFDQPARLSWLICCVNWATNSAVDESGFSPSQWVLGRGIRLPYSMLSQTGRLSLHERHTRDHTFAERVAMLAAAQRSILSLRYS